MLDRLSGYFVVLLAAWVVCLTQSAAGESRGPVEDAPFVQEYRDPFLTGTAEENDVRAIAVDSEQRVWIASGAGVRVRRNDAWTAPEGAALDGPAFDLATAEDGTIWVAAFDGLYRIDAGSLTRVEGIDEPLAAVAAQGKRVVAAGPGGVWQREGQAWQPLPIQCATSIRTMLLRGDDLWVGTGIGLYRYHHGDTERFYRADQLLSADVSSLAVAADGRLWIGSSGGIDVYEGEQRVASYTGSEGLPCTRVHALAIDAQGRIWAGTDLGAARFDGQQWSLRHSHRWVPSDLVRAIAFADGGTYLATDGGVSVLRERRMTLAEKADFYQQLVRARHVREPGLVERCDMREPGNLETYYAVDTDNDGLFTGLYVASEAYRYAVTGDPAAARNAREGYRAMEFLQTVTDTPGFFARTVIPADWTEMADRNRTHTPREIAEERIDDPRWKQVEVRWRKSSDGKWLWKGDTSSDETTGHYFAYAVYYDLVADEEEKERVRQHVARITDYIIDGGYVLRDIDGRATRWGVWAPEKLNGDPNWRLDRGVNSLEILSFLKTAYHMTSDSKYEEAARDLIEQHRYGENVAAPQQVDPASFTYIDSQLLALAYSGLMTYELDPRRRAIYLPGVQQWFEPVREDHSPLYSFVYASAAGQPVDVEQCVAFLRKLPLDMIDWSVDNTRREDVELVRRPSIEPWQTDRLLPSDERRVNKWDGNPYTAHGGTGGRSENSSVYWLLPYWMGRYLGLISAPAAS